MSDKVLTANHLLSGEVVFLSEGELWTPNIGEALIAESEEQESWLEKAGKRALDAQIVVEPHGAESSGRCRGASRVHGCADASILASRASES